MSCVILSPFACHSDVGCIPSKALLHAAIVITEAAEMAENGISFGNPEINLHKLRAWKEKVVGAVSHASSLS